MNHPRQRRDCTSCGASIEAAAAACPKCGHTRAADSPPRYVGTRVAGRYQVIERIARGGMGEVYRAEHVEMKQPAAVKFLHRKFAEDEEFAARFFNEAQYSSRVTHPNAVRLFDFGRLEDGTLYIVMEYVRGRCLTDVVAEMGMMPVQLALRVAAQVADVLAGAHELRIVHRDVKPDNIMLLRTAGERFSVKVLDFGIARALDETDGVVTETGVMFGTPEYMSPEQARGKKVDGRSDVYSLGMLLYFMLAGSPPFYGKNKLSIIHRQVDEIPERVDRRARQPLAPAIVDLIHRMIAKDIETRPQTMMEVVRELESLEVRGEDDFEAARLRSARHEVPSLAQPPQDGLRPSLSDVEPARGTEHFAPNYTPTPPEERRLDYTRRRSGTVAASLSRLPSMARTIDGPSAAGAGALTGVAALPWARRQIAAGRVHDEQRKIDSVATDGAQPLPSRPLRSAAIPGALLALLVAGLGVYLLSSRLGLETPDDSAAAVTATSSDDSEIGSGRNEAEQIAAETGQNPDPQGDVAALAASAMDGAAPSDRQRETRIAELAARVDRALDNARFSDAQDALATWRTVAGGARADLTRRQARYDELTGLHASLQAALDANNCTLAIERAQTLSDTAGTRHLDDWRARVRSCEPGTEEAQGVGDEAPDREAAVVVPSRSEPTTAQPPAETVTPTPRPPASPPRLPIEPQPTAVPQSTPPPTPPRPLAPPPVAPQPSTRPSVVLPGEL